MVYNAATGSADFMVPVTLGANQTFYAANATATLNLGAVELASLQTLTVDGRGDLVAMGVVSGTGGITKLGDGVLALAGANTFDGMVNVTQGSLSLRSDGALGSTAGGTIAGLGTSILLDGGVTVGENIVVRDVVRGFDLNTLGAIRSVAGTNRLTGTISMTNHGSFGADAGSTLIVTGAVMVLPGVSDGGLTKFGSGTLELGGTADNVITGQVTVLQGTLVLSKDRSGAATPMPFNAGLVIGDNRDGVAAADAPKVVLAARDQIPEINFFRTSVTAVTVNSTGTLDLNGFDDQVGSLTLVVGRSSAGKVTTGAGTLSLLGDVTVNNFQGSSGASPAARISGNLNLGTFFSGNSGGTATRAFTVNDTALFSLNPDLVVDANISGGPQVSLTKAGAGTLQLSGINSYQGATRLTAGLTDIGSDAAFGASSMVAVSGGFLRSVDAAGNPAAHSITGLVPWEFDGDFGIYGSGGLMINGQVTLTGTRTVTDFDPNQVTTITAGIGEWLFPNSGLTKRGRGELNIAGPAMFTGQLTIGQVITGSPPPNPNTADGGTLRLSGPNGALTRNLNTIAVGVNGSLVLDNSAGNNADRLPDAAPIDLYGILRVVGNGGGTTETVGVVRPQAGFTSTIASDTTGAGNNRLILGGLNATGTNAAVTFAAGGSPLSEAGQNQINVLQAPANMPVTSNVIANAVVLNPDGSADFATLTTGTVGRAITALPAACYVTSFDAANPTSNVKITSGTVTLDRSRTVNALFLGPGVTVNGVDTTGQLTVAAGPVVLSAGSRLAVPYLSLTPNAAAASTKPFFLVAPSGAAFLSSSIAGTTGGTLTKGGLGALFLEGANQFSGSFVAGQGVVTIRHSTALGSASAGTTVNLGAELVLDGSLTVLGESLSAFGMGTNLGAYGVGMSNNDGVVLAANGNSQWTGSVSLGGVVSVDATALFPNGGFTTFSGSGVNVAPGASLNLSGAVSGGADLIKLGGGHLELSGTLANTISQGPRVKQGTLLLNKFPGVAAVAITGATLSVGDDVAGNTATVKFGASYQFGAANLGNTVTVASNGTLDLAGTNQGIATLNLVVGPLGGAGVTVGAGGTLTATGNVTVHALGGGGPAGATISGGTLALDTFNTSGASTPHTYTVNDGAAGADGTDLTISSAIVDGTGFRPNGVTQGGFGALKYTGGTANTYTGTTTVNDGALLLSKTPGVPAMSGPLTVGDGSLQGGAAQSDVVRLLAANQLPDWQALVTVNGTGLLDLNNFSDAIGTADGQTALTVTGGVVRTGSGTLTLNGDLVTTATFGIGTLPVTNNAIVAPVVAGKLNLGSGYARTLTVNDRGELLVDAVISADLSGSADVFKVTGGNLLLSGNNAGWSGSLSINSNPGFNQPALSVGSDTALGTGTVFPVSTVHIGADGGPRTIANRVITQDLRLAGGNDLTLFGAVDLNQSATFTVFAPVNFTLAGGLGELVNGLSLGKSGAGALVFTAPALISGSLTINAAGGSVIATGAGSLPNVSSATINVGGTLLLDNTTSAVGDRFRDAAPVTLAGRALEFRGNAATALTESVGTIQTNSNFSSTITSVTQGAAATLSANQLTRQASSFVSFRGYGADLGSATNRLMFYTPPTQQLLNGVLPFGTVAKAGDLDFAGYDPARGVVAVAGRTSLAGATASDNVKLTGSQSLTAATAINALLVVGSNVTVGGTVPLLVGSGLLVGDGVNNKLSTPLQFGGATALVNVSTLARPTLGTSVRELAGAIDGVGGVTKVGTGRLTLSGANTYAGTTNVFEGVLRAANSAALGFGAGGTPSEGTVVVPGAALELDNANGDLNIAVEALTLSGFGFGYGNTTALLGGDGGALRSRAGSNTWGGPITLPSPGNDQTLAVAFGADAGTLTLTGALTGGGTGNGNSRLNINKVGGGTLILAGSTAATTVGGGTQGQINTTVFEGTLALNKTPGVNALPNQVQTNVQVGDNVGPAGADVLRLLAPTKSPTPTARSPSRVPACST